MSKESRELEYREGRSKGTGEFSEQGANRSKKTREFENKDQTRKKLKYFERD